MSGKQNSINPVTNDDSSARTSMMDMWRQSIERSQKSQTTAAQVMQSGDDSKVDLEQRVRNGQAQCETCKNRQYADESDDGGVSFQAAKHISAATAGVVVMNHENEHVAEADSKSGVEKGVIKDSTVSLEYGKCPDCGKTYVKGGLTKTTTRPASYNASPRIGGLDAQA